MLKASVCIAAFNKPKHLENTLASICRQQGDFEVIVVDDGSKDREISDVCKHFPVHCIRIDREPVFRNPCAARNVAYKAARADIIIAQSDEVLHVTEDAISRLCSLLEKGKFVIANVFNKEKDGTITSEFTGPTRQKPFFFLGALWRRDLYNVGGNDEDFLVAPGYEDAWFADCLIQGLGLQPIFTTEVVGHHQWHPNYNLAYDDAPVKRLYARKTLNKQYFSAGGPWPFVEFPEVEGRVQDIFTKVYHENSWGSAESRSGAGSTLEATKQLRNALPALIEKYQIKSILDLPCGDFNWMKEVDLSGVDYIGADIVEPLIAECKEKHGRDFRVLDLLSSKLPKADLLICRDCLVHFSQADILTAMQNVRAAGIKYILTTTFTNRNNDKAIVTGQWTPYNLQRFPFNLPEPIELVNEDCREWYPHFADKSMALWEVSQIEKTLFPTKSITVCVDYDDFLAITLPRNMQHFSKTLVVTSSKDTATQEVCKKYGVECHVTDVFYANGAAFNKGAAMEEGFDKLGRDGWICVWDVDIVMPKDIFIHNRDTKRLYSPIRRILPNPAAYADELDWQSLKSPTQAHEFSGFFQLFHASAQTSRPWYGVDWKHAGGCDSDFQFKYAKDKLRRTEFEVLHLGPEGVVELHTRIGRNWLGRVQPRIDTGSVPAESAVREQGIKQLIRERDKYGTQKEKITVLTRVKIPKTISFFWTGRMSWMRYLTLETFCKLNPNWSVNLYLYKQPMKKRTWSSGEEDDAVYSGYDYLQEVHHLPVSTLDYDAPKKLPAAQVSDLFQWSLLGTSGGYYADMDILWLRPLDEIAEVYPEADAIFSLESRAMAIGFFGAVPHCQIFKDIYNTAVRSDGTAYQHYGTDLLYKMFGRNGKRMRLGAGDVCLHNIREKYRELNVVDINDKLIYPLDWRGVKFIFDEDYEIYPDAVGMHWFAGSPIAQKWNRLLTPENWRQYQNTFTTKLATVL